MKANGRNSIKANLIYLFMVFCLAHTIGIVINVQNNILIQIISVAIGGILVKFFLFNPLILYILISILAIISVIVHRNITPFLFPLASRGISLISNIYLNLRGFEPILEENSYIFFIIIIVFISFITSLILFKLKKIFILLPLYIISFLYYWYSYVDRAYIMLAVFLISFLILVGSQEFSQEINIQRLYSTWENTSIKYSILIIVMAILLPKTNYTFQWPWLYNRVYNSFPIIERLRSNSSYNRSAGNASLFNFSITGFQTNENRLGGPVILSDRMIMTVESQDRLYLRGNVKYTYTGHSWELADEASRSSLAGMNFGNISLEERELYYRDKMITITHNNFSSTTLFSPYRPNSLTYDLGDDFMVGDDYELVYPNGVYDGESYTIFVLEPLPYGLLMTQNIHRTKNDIENIERYLQIPDDDISERTRLLTKTITHGLENDFEKARALELYLRDSYEYKLEPSQVPKEFEFIDYFLFEGLEGYCTYYATALAIMLRLEGIPTRYIEGYLAQDRLEDGIYEVRQRNAHAWVEAFIEPVGWMTFEATPEYPIEDRMENLLKQDIEEDIEDRDSTIIEAEDHIIRDRPDLIFDEDIFDFDIDYYIEDRQEANESLILFRNSFIIILLAILPIRYLVGYASFIKQEKSFVKKKNRERIIYLYQQIVKILDLLNYPQELGETHYEYAGRIAYKFYSYNDIGFKDITHIFVKTKYSMEEADENDLQSLIAYRDSLDKKLRQAWGFRYYYRKYISLMYWKV